ncbi:MAG: DedA family protein [Syntrophomonadaceae bacterium]|nr:DedA family protein [Syntrophomonadaceae bacterium]
MNTSLILDYISAHGYIAAFTAFLFELLALPLPGETIMTYMGYLVYQGKLSWIMSVLSVSLGALTGITLAYYIGRTVGSPLVFKYGHYVWLDQDTYNKVARWLDLHGNKIIVVAYFVPGLRHVSGYMCGILNLPFAVFASNAGTGAILYALVFVSLGRYLGPDWEKILSMLKTHVEMTASVLMLLILGYLALKNKKKPAPNEITALKNRLEGEPVKEYEQNIHEGRNN